MPFISNTNRTRYQLWPQSDPVCPNGIAYEILKGVNPEKAAQILGQVTVPKTPLDRLKLNQKCERTLLDHAEFYMDACQEKNSPFWTEARSWISMGLMHQAEGKARLAEKALKNADSEKKTVNKNFTVTVEGNMSGGNISYEQTNYHQTQRQRQPDTNSQGFFPNLPTVNNALATSPSAADRSAAKDASANYLEHQDRFGNGGAQPQPQARHNPSGSQAAPPQGAPMTQPRLPMRAGFAIKPALASKPQLKQAPAHANASSSGPRPSSGVFNFKDYDPFYNLGVEYPSPPNKKKAVSTSPTTQALNNIEEDTHNWEDAYNWEEEYGKCAGSNDRAGKGEDVVAATAGSHVTASKPANPFEDLFSSVDSSNASDASNWLAELVKTTPKTTPKTMNPPSRALVMAPTMPPPPEDLTGFVQHHIERVEKTPETTFRPNHQGIYAQIGFPIDETKKVLLAIQEKAENEEEENSAEFSRLRGDLSRTKKELSYLQIFSFSLSEEGSSRKNCLKKVARVVNVDENDHAAVLDRVENYNELAALTASLLRSFQHDRTNNVLVGGTIENKTLGKMIELLQAVDHLDSDEDDNLN